MTLVIADIAAEESVQAVDFRAGQNFGEAKLIQGATMESEGGQVDV